MSTRRSSTDATANGNGRVHLAERSAESHHDSAEEIFRRLSERPAELLRFATAGSVDDGKSTLIGRLLWESKTLYDDQLAALAGDPGEQAVWRTLHARRVRRLALVEFRHDFFREQIQALADILMRRFPSLIEQDYLVDMSFFK